MSRAAAGAAPGGVDGEVVIEVGGPPGLTAGGTPIWPRLADAKHLLVGEVDGGADGRARTMRRRHVLDLLVKLTATLANTTVALAFVWGTMNATGALALLAGVGAVTAALLAVRAALTAVPVDPLLEVLDFLEERTGWGRRRDRFGGGGTGLEATIGRPAGCAGGCLWWSGRTLVGALVRWWLNQGERHDQLERHRRMKAEDERNQLNTRLAWASVILGIVSVVLAVVAIVLTLALAGWGPWAPA